MNPFNFAYGIKVVKDINCTKETNEPVKIHTKKSNKAYHRRIQKKWNKRYGFNTEYTSFYFDSPNGPTILCHPAIYDEIIRKIKSAA